MPERNFEKPPSSETIDKETWQNAVWENIHKLSRTTSGTHDTSSSAHKPQTALAEGADLANQAQENIDRTLNYLWEHQQQRFEDGDSVRKFIESIARLVNEGIAKSDSPLYRAHETMYPSTAPADIEKEFQTFCKWLAEHLDKEDAKTVAALVEKKIDGDIHPFQDGCGRTAHLTSAYFLLRKGLPPPQYDDRTTHYQELVKEQAQWISYYKSLFNQKK